MDRAAVGRIRLFESSTDISFFDEPKNWSDTPISGAAKTCSNTFHFRGSKRPVPTPFISGAKNLFEHLPFQEPKTCSNTSHARGWKPLKQMQNMKDFRVWKPLSGPIRDFRMWNISGTAARLGKVVETPGDLRVSGVRPLKGSEVSGFGSRFSSLGCVPRLRLGISGFWFLGFDFLVFLVSGFGFRGSGVDRGDREGSRIGEEVRGEVECCQRRVVVPVQELGLRVFTNPNL